MATKPPTSITIRIPNGYSFCLCFLTSGLPPHQKFRSSVVSNPYVQSNHHVWCLNLKPGLSIFSWQISAFWTVETRFTSNFISHRIHVWYINANKLGVYWWEMLPYMAYIRIPWILWVLWNWFQSCSFGESRNSSSFFPVPSFPRSSNTHQVPAPLGPHPAKCPFRCWISGAARWKGQYSTGKLCHGL